MGLLKDMGDRHEEHVAALMGTTPTPGSGNQWRAQMDGRTSRMTKAFAFAWDCKSTFLKSIGVSKEMWAKACRQAHGERPAIPLRFYETKELREDKAIDLVVIGLDDFVELVEKANEPQLTVVVVNHREPDVSLVIQGSDIRVASKAYIQTAHIPGRDPRYAIQVDNQEMPQPTVLCVDGTAYCVNGDSFARIDYDGQQAVEDALPW